MKDADIEMKRKNSYSLFSQKMPAARMYPAKDEKTKKYDDLFKMMEFKLATVIMRPAMIGTWIFGLALVFTPGIVDWAAVWPWTKGASVFAMTGFHGWLVGRVKAFAAGENLLSGKRYRIMNEVPTLLMIIIVFSVVVKF